MTTTTSSLDDGDAGSVDDLVSGRLTGDSEVVSSSSCSMEVLNESE